MKVISKKTRLSSDEVILRAKTFFENNLGLTLAEETAGCCVEFRSKLGFVIVQAMEEDKEREVTVSTREYEYQIQEFLKKV